ncbi:MAG: GIY-YIG nuclease family protein [bacterium]|nr:GIY-YIG nuclease family protein [bacterium]
MLLRKDLKKAPNLPGIYFFKNKAGKILYIGKALNLRLRLLSYIDTKTLSAAKQRMIAEAAKVEWKECESEIEALIEEAVAIKRFRPKYNIVFRDDKQYLFVGFTREKFPKIFITHQTQKLRTENYKLKTDYIGPFTEALSLRLVLKSLQKIFPYCTCRERHKRPCQRYEIGRCLGICCADEKFFADANEHQNNYKKNIRAIKTVLKGKRPKVLKNLEKEMHGFSRERNFEEARKIRDQIFALENIFKHAPVIRRELDPERQKALVLAKELLGLADIPRRIEGYDISNLQGKNAVGSMVVFYEGAPKKEDYRLFKIRYKKTPDDIAMLQEVLLRRLRHDEWPLPDLFLIDGGLGQLNAAKQVLDLYQLTIPVVALAKREEELWVSSKKKFQLKRLSPAVLYLFQNIRNEAHRFAINFHRKHRSKTLLDPEL